MKCIPDLKGVIDYSVKFQLCFCCLQNLKVSKFYNAPKLHYSKTPSIMGLKLELTCHFCSLIANSTNTNIVMVQKGNYNNIVLTSYVEQLSFFALRSSFSPSVPSLAMHSCNRLIDHRVLSIQTNKLLKLR